MSSHMRPQSLASFCLLAILVFGGAIAAVSAKWEEIDASFAYKPHQIPDHLVHRLYLQFVIGTVCFAAGLLWLAWRLWTNHESDYLSH
jgi:hypothetical protein